MSQRTRGFHCAVVDEFRRLPLRDEAERELWRQLLRTVTSLATNCAEADGTQSRRDFIQKFHIALKEARESLQLVRLLVHACPSRAVTLSVLEQECDALVAILVKSLITAKANEQLSEHRGRPKRASGRPYEP